MALAVLLQRKGGEAELSEAQREAERAFRLAPEVVSEALAGFYGPAGELIETRSRRRAENEEKARAEGAAQEKLAAEAKALEAWRAQALRELEEDEREQKAIGSTQMSGSFVLAIAVVVLAFVALMLWSAHGAPRR